MSITNGIVSIEDGTKASEEFAPARKVRVELHFGIEEGSDPVAVLDGVRALADSRVQLMLNRKVAEAPKAATPAATVAGEKAPSTRKKPAAAAPQAEPATTKADLAKAAGIPVGDTVHKAAADELEDPPEPKTTVPADPDDLNDLLGDSAPVPVTDQELGKAAQEKNGKMKGVAGWAPEKIRKLVAEFAGEGKRISDVPAAKRQEFLKKLEELK